MKNRIFAMFVALSSLLTATAQKHIGNQPTPVPIDPVEPIKKTPSFIATSGNKKTFRFVYYSEGVTKNDNVCIIDVYRPVKLAFSFHN